MVEGIVFFRNRVDANQAVAQNSALEGLAIARTNAADSCQVPRIWTDFEILVGHLGRYRRREFSERLPMFDKNVEVLGGIGIQGRRENASIAERARAEFHAALHPGDNLLAVDLADGALHQFFGGE